MVGAVAQAELLAQPLRAAGLRPGPLQQGLHVAGPPAAPHEGGARIRRGAGAANQLDHLFDVGQRHRLPLQQVAALPGALQQVQGAPGDHLLAVLQEGFQHLLEVEHPRLAIDQGDAVDAEDGLQLGLRVEVVQHHVPGLAPAQFDDDAQAVLVGLVAQFGDALDALLLDQLGDLLDQPGLVELVGNLGDDDGLPVGLVVALHLRPSPDIDAPAPGAVGFDDAGAPVDDAGGGEVRPLDVLHQIVDADERVVHQGQQAIDHFAQVVRRDVGGHAHGDAGTAVDEQVGRLGGQHLRHGQSVVVVGAEGHGLLVQVRQQFGG